MKDNETVGRYYNEMQETEFLMCHFLNEKMPIKLRKQGVFFEIQTDGQYSKNDIVLIKISPNREKIVIAKIEYECGARQVYWNAEMPRDKWQALNLVTRKKYGETFSLFIKSSRTFNSFFAIDCRNNFVQTNFPDTEVLDYDLEFETDNEFYRIYWDDVAKNLYQVDDDKKEIQNKNICIIENTNDWSLFYRFLWQRFLNTKKGS